MCSYPRLSALLMMLGACSSSGTSDDDGFSLPGPASPDEEGEPKPEALVIEEVIDGPSGGFPVRLTLPVTDRVHPVVIFVPGLGPSTADWAYLSRGGGPSSGDGFHWLGLGTLAFSLPGCTSGPFATTPPAIADAEAFGTATRSLVLERARAALAWAREQPRVAASGHFVLTKDFGGADGLRLADEIAAEALLWWMPIVQTASEYLHDELHYRDWLRRSWLADTDDDGAVTPEEWGFYKGSSGYDANVSFEDIDASSDGVYTREDNELSGASLLPIMEAHLADGDDVAWRVFWNERASLFPSTSWAADAFARPGVAELLAGGVSPIFVFAGQSPDTPLEYVDALSGVPGAERLRLFAGGAAALPTPGVAVREALSCLRGLVAEPLDPHDVEALNERVPPMCSW